MSIRLSRKKINDMVDRDYSFSSRRGGGSGAGGGGGVSSTWVDEHYVSKEFFARLFTVNGTDENNDDVVVEPNDLETTIKNIQVMVGLWTEQYLSALGLSDGSSGGGGAIALQDLVNVEYVGTPSGGQILKYNGTTGKWYNADDGGGTVQDVTLAMPEGFSVDSQTSQGTIALTVSLDRGEGASALGNKLFLGTPVTGDGAPSWRAITADDVDFSNYTFWGQRISNGVVTGSITVGNGYILLNNDKGLFSYNAPAEGETAATIELMRLRSNNTARLFYGTAAAGYSTLIYGNAIALRYGADGTNGLIITSSGLITIGTGSTSSFVTEKLNVNGNIRTATSNGSYIQIGDIRLIYDSTNTAIKVEKSDGTAAGLYATGFLSALGANSSSGGGGGSSTLAGLNDVEITSPTAGQTLVYRGTHWVNESVGTVTSVGLSMPTGFSVASSPVTTTGTIAVTFGGSIAKNRVLASPSTAAGAPTWRKLAAADIPSLTADKISDISLANDTITIGSSTITPLTDTTLKSNYSWWGQTMNSSGVVTGSITVGNGHILLNNSRGLFSYNVPEGEETAESIELVRMRSDNNIRLCYGTYGKEYNTFIYGYAIGFRYGLSGTTGMVIQTTGNVGIGTSQPTTKLEVNGTIKCASINIGGYVITADTTNGGLRINSGGIYADDYISALGMNNSGGGGGGVTLNEPLSSINTSNIGKPASGTMVGNAIVWTGTGWGYKAVPDTTGGTVTSVGMTVPTGFSVSTASITTSGTFAITFASGYSLPKTADVTKGVSAYNKATTLEGYFDSGSAKTAKKLTTAVTLWGNSFDGSAGLGTAANDTADLTYVGDISMSGSIIGCTDIDSILNFDTTNSRVGVGASSPSTRLHVKGRITAEYDSTYSGSFQAIRGNYVTQFGINSSGYALIATGQNGSSSPTVRLSFTPYTETTDPHILTGTSSLKIGTDGTNFYDGKYMQIGAVRMVYNASNTLKVIKADNTTANLEVSGRAIVNSIDLMGENDSGTYYSYLDFHYNGSTADYTTRLIETANAELSIRSNSGSTKTGLVVGRAVDGDYVKIGDIYIGYDSANDALEVYKISGNSHASANLYARGAVSALGQGGSGSGGGIDLNTMWNALENSASTHSIGTSTNGLNALYATSIYANGVQVLTSSNGVTLDTAQTISGQKTFSGNLLAKKIQMTASNAATYLEHTKLYSPNATMTIQGSDSAQNLTLCTGGGNVGIGTAADNTHKMKVSGSSLFDGNVGIGGYNSSYKLYVSGTTCTSSLKVNNTYEFVINWDNDEFFEVGAYNREIHAIGSWYGSWRGSSDIRKKNVVSKVDVDVAQIAELPIFNFTWKNSTDKDTYLGTSAQDVKKLFPSAVSVMSDGMLGMAYGETALAAAVMTARKVVDHEARIKQLEKEIELLKTMQA